MSKVTNQTRRGFFLTFVICWEAWFVISAILQFPKLQYQVIQTRPYYYVDLVSTIIVPLPQAVSIVGIWRWRRWGIYTLVCALGFLFIETIISFLIRSENLAGMPIFIAISAMSWIVWWLTLRSKWHAFR